MLPWSSGSGLHLGPFLSRSHTWLTAGPRAVGPDAVFSNQTGADSSSVWIVLRMGPPSSLHAASQLSVQAMHAQRRSRIQPTHTQP